MRAHLGEFRLQSMCRVLGVHRSGYYVWQRQLVGVRKREDDRLLGLIKHSWLTSGGVYGYRKITVDLRESGETCAEPRVRADCPEPGLGDGHRVHPHLRRLVVSGGRHGSVLAPDCRLGHALDDDQRAGFAGIHEGAPHGAEHESAGHCHDNAVAESFCSALKKERIKRRIYPNRTAAITDLFDYIEMFYNPIRRHGSAGDLSPIEFERRHALNGS